MQKKNSITASYQLQYHKINFPRTIFLIMLTKCILLNNILYHHHHHDHLAKNYIRNASRGYVGWGGSIILTMCNTAVTLYWVTKQTSLSGHWSKTRGLGEIMYVQWTILRWSSSRQAIKPSRWSCSLATTSDRLDGSVAPLCNIY